LHSLESGSWKIRDTCFTEDFYLQLNARRHDFRGARGMKIDGITRLFPRLDGASGGFASDLVSSSDKPPPNSSEN
jgi:hypothetical protein